MLRDKCWSHDCKNILVIGLICLKTSPISYLSLSSRRRAQGCVRVQHRVPFPGRFPPVLADPLSPRPGDPGCQSAGPAAPTPPGTWLEQKHSGIRGAARCSPGDPQPGEQAPLSLSGGDPAHTLWGLRGMGKWGEVGSWGVYWGGEGLVLKQC